MSLCTVCFHFSEDAFSLHLLRPEVRPFVSVPRIFTHGPSGLFEFQISQFSIRSFSYRVNLALPVITTLKEKLLAK